jgi:pSer/pThr/pTyr-binding forkhead associated (FHA) protein
VPFRLKYRAHDFALPRGDFYVGRSPECELALDDQLISRKHARFRTTSTSVFVDDLGSRNGVRVNGQLVRGTRELEAGDRIEIGGQELMLTQVVSGLPLGATAVGEQRIAVQTLSAIPILDMAASLEDDVTVNAEEASRFRAADRNTQSFRVLAGVADKALAMGKPEEAERVLQIPLYDLAEKTKAGEPVEPEMIELAAVYAARLAASSAKSSWYNYAIDLFARHGRLPSPAVVDELYAAVRKVKSHDLRPLRAYLALVREKALSSGPAERFLLQRLEGLERLASL